MLALAAMRLKLPAVIGAFDIRAIELTERKREGAMRADVAKREGLSAGIATDYERHLEQHSPDELATAYLVAPQSGIPKAPEDFGGAVSWSDGRVVHREVIVVQAAQRGKPAAGQRARSGNRRRDARAPKCANNR